MRTSGRRIGTVMIAIACLIWGGMAAPVSFAAPSSTAPEYIIKAAYLLNFARLIEWPGDAFATGTSPITIGVVGSDPFGQALDVTVEGKKISNRQIVVRRFQWGQDLRQCQIVFISSADSSRLAELTSRVGGSPVLIVSEGTDLAKRGATINFTIEDDRVRFEVNVEAAKRARLTISSQVLRVARIVREG